MMLNISTYVSCEGNLIIEHNQRIPALASEVIPDHSASEKTMLEIGKMYPVHFISSI